MARHDLHIIYKLGSFRLKQVGVRGSLDKQAPNVNPESSVVSQSSP